MIGTGNTGTGKRSELQCPQAKQLFSPYLDGAVTGTEMLALQDHLAECPACHRRVSGAAADAAVAGQCGRPKVPADLGLKLRLAISREAALAQRARFEGLMVRLENALQAFMVPATAGF